MGLQNKSNNGYRESPDSDCKWLFMNKHPQHEGHLVAVFNKKILISESNGDRFYQKLIQLEKTRKILPLIGRIPSKKDLPRI